MPQLAIRFPDETLARLDLLIASGAFANRAEAARAAVDRLIADSEHRRTDMAVIAGYERIPDAAPDGWLEAATQAMVSAEPW